MYKTHSNWFDDKLKDMQEKLKLLIFLNINIQELLYGYNHFVNLLRYTKDVNTLIKKK